MKKTGKNLLQAALLAASFSGAPKLLQNEKKKTIPKNKTIAWRGLRYTHIHYISLYTDICEYLTLQAKCEPHCFVPFL